MTSKQLEKPRNDTSLRPLWTVMVRIRPASPDQERPQHTTDDDLHHNTTKNTIGAFSNNQTSLILRNPSTGERTQYKASYIFDSQMPNNKGGSQKAIFDKVGQRIVDQVLNNINSTLIMYGETGSGKSHTLIGTSQQPGLLARISTALFSGLISHQRDLVNHTKIEVTVSAMEIYKERIRDLGPDRNDQDEVGDLEQEVVILNNNCNKNKKGAGRLKVLESKEMGVYVDGLSSVLVKTANDLLIVIRECEMERIDGGNVKERNKMANVVYEIKVNTMTIINESGHQYQKMRVSVCCFLLIVILSLYITLELNI